MRKIKFRAWDFDIKRMYEVDTLGMRSHGATFTHWEEPDENGKICRHLVNYELMQFTNLHDKNGLTEIYEGDIIGVDGIKKGNIYENENLLQKETDLIIPPITSKDWQTTYIEAMGRGCRHSE